MTLDRRSPGATSELDVPPIFQDAVEERLGEILVMEHITPSPQRLVGGEKGRSALDVPGIDDGVQDIGRIGGMREVAELINDEHFGGDKGLCGISELTDFCRLGELIDEMGGDDVPGIVASLYGSECNGDGQMGLSAPRFSGKHEIPPRDCEIRGEIRGDQVSADTALGGEGEVIDRLEIREARCTGQSLHPGLIPVEHLRHDEMGKEFPVAPLAIDGQSLGIIQQPTDGRQGKAPQKERQVAGRRGEIGRENGALLHGCAPADMAGDGRSAATTALTSYRP